MIYIIDKSLKKLPYISTAKAGSFTATFGKIRSLSIAIFHPSVPYTYILANPSVLEYNKEL